jgi:hypothetical protein
MNYSELSDFEFTQRLAPPPPLHFISGEKIYIFELSNESSRVFVKLIVF